MSWHRSYCTSLIAIFFQVFILWAKPQSRFLQFSLTIPNFDYKLRVTLLQLAIPERKRRKKKREILGSKTTAVAWSQLNCKGRVKRYICRITVSSIALQTTPDKATMNHMLGPHLPLKWQSDRLMVADTGRKGWCRGWGLNDSVKCWVQTETPCSSHIPSIPTSNPNLCLKKWVSQKHRCKVFHY